MDKWHKEVVASELKTEKKVLNELKKTYEDASKQIDDKIAQLLGRSDANMQHVIYQVQYQQALKKQVDGVLDTLNGTQFTKVSDYLQQSYEDGFVGTLYTLQQQGVPLMFPIDQEQVTKAVINNSKIKEGLYKKLGIDVGDLKKAIRSEISRGISTGSSYADMARNVNNQMGIGLNKSIRIARTEGHRISQESRYDAMKKAKDAGADVVKQWDSTLDKRTRPHHQALDGAVAELDDTFKIAGRAALMPSGFGVASEDINCRCVVLEVGRWEIDEKEATSKMVDGQIKDFSSIKDYNTFKKQYWGWQKGQKSATSAFNKIAKENKGDVLKTLQTSLIKTQKAQNALNKTFSGIWKDDVTPADYASKKASIQAKKDWYSAQIASGNLTDAKKVQFEQYIKDLDEFDTLGQQYEKYDSEIAKLNSEIAKKMPKPKASDAFTDERKNNALWFSSKNGGADAADKAYRPKSGEIWRTAPKAEKDSIFRYTSSYSPYNEPLRGVEYGTNAFKGVGNVDLDDIGVSYQGWKKGYQRDQINKLSAYIERNSYDKDIWVQRGVGYRGMDKFFGLDLQSMNLSDARTKLLGTTPTEFGFMSTGVARGEGFGGNIILNIYAPRGTKMAYVEPFSAFGDGMADNWDGRTGSTGRHGECEMILQRGTKFRVTKVEQSNGTWYVDMDVIEQAEGNI